MAKKHKKNTDNKESAEVKNPAGKEEQGKAHNKILRNILIGIVILLIGIVVIVFVSKSFSHFEYRGVKFEIVRFCDAGPPCLITYRTTLPVKVLGKNVSIIQPSEKDADYNFYFRNDPRKLSVDFNGTLKFAKNMVFNTESDFACNGYGAIAGANFNLLYKILGTKVISDKNATCDSQERYILVTVKPGNETRIVEYSPSCYDIYIKDCEVLEGTEKFMIEALVKVNEALKEEE